MYSRFFGFKERPFKLIPNPAYLYLSKSHEEVLAHLTYAVNHGDGFVEITGEVGTGKTTLCRVFVEKLDPSTEAAYIFNPKLDAVQLLKAINTEFGIDAGPDTCKELIDVLNTFLMSAKANNRQVLLIIDEAQNLNTEVLEQLRLLSNLETTQSKLLQIILVGQPELNEKLNSYELRQLGQRISLSCRLMPMTCTETQAYIQHRVRIGSHKGDGLFAFAAMRTIHRYSGGIPRLINIACDRALLTAYGRNQRKVTGRIAQAAVKELVSRNAPSRHSRWRTASLWLTVAAVGLLFVCGVLMYPGVTNIGGILPSVQYQEPQVPLDPPPGNPDNDQPDDTAPSSLASPPSLSVDVSDTSAAGPQVQDNVEPTNTVIPERSDSVGATAPEPITSSLHDFLSALDGRASRRKAVRSLLKLWDLEVEVAPYLDQLENADEFFERVSQQSGLQSYRLSGDFDLIKKLNLPAVLVFNLPGRPEHGYLALREITDDNVILTSDEGVLIVADPALLLTYYANAAFVFWKNFDALDGVIPLTSSAGAIMALKMLLKEIGFEDIRVSARYDEKTRQAIRDVQRRHGLVVDGFVGPLTKIVLYNEKRALPIPHLVPGS